MLSSVLRSPLAIQMNIEIMCAFIRFRQIVESHAELARKLDALEKKYDAQFKEFFEVIRQLMVQPELKRCAIGFRKGDKRNLVLEKTEGNRQTCSSSPAPQHLFADQRYFLQSAAKASGIRYA